MILGLDLSLTATGLAVWQNDALQCYTLKTPSKLKGDARLDWLDTEIGTLAKRTPRLVVIEGASFHSRSASADEIAGLHRLVRLGLFRLGIPYIIAAPIQLKKFATGSTKADKSTIVREVWRRWDVEAADDNQADAATLVQIGRGVIGQLQMTSFQREVAVKIADKFQAALKHVEIQPARLA